MTASRFSPVRLFSAAALLVMAGCATVPIDDGVGEREFLEELPEGLAETAATGQDMTRVIISAEDACYWYEHVGPVENTFLPLRSAAGRPICSEPRT